MFALIEIVIEWLMCSYIVFLDFFFIVNVVSVGVVFAVTICSVVEAMTSQVDNIVLPFLMFIILSIAT